MICVVVFITQTLETPIKILLDLRNLTENDLCASSNQKRVLCDSQSHIWTAVCSPAVAGLIYIILADASFIRASICILSLTRTFVAFNIKSESELIKEKDLNIQMPCRLSTEMVTASTATFST